METLSFTVQPPLASSMSYLDHFSDPRIGGRYAAFSPLNEINYPHHSNTDPSCSIMYPSSFARVIVQGMTTSAFALNFDRKLLDIPAGTLPARGVAL